MRILFISLGQGPDYQCDMLLHRLRSLYANDAVDVNRLPYLYRSDYPEGSQIKRQLYGRGFTIYGLLGDDHGVDRTDIKAKIANRFFDLVIFGSVRRCKMFLYEVLGFYDSRRIIFIDGEDDQRVEEALLGRGLYFKRELLSPIRCGFPIQFAIPVEKLTTIPTSKTKTVAFVDPRDRNTYIYDQEVDYYRDYAESLFGTTTKKAGWDCLRHYEIMANRCIPNFVGLEGCPSWTMPFLPKFELIEVARILQFKGPELFKSDRGHDLWKDLEARLYNIVRRHLTTEALARYVVETAADPHRSLGSLM